MTLRLAAGAAYVFAGIAALVATGQAEAGLGKASFGAIQVHSSQEIPSAREGESLDPKCVKAFDTVMESCDGRDIGLADEPAGDAGDYADAGQDDGDQADDGDFAADGQFEDGFEIAAYSL